jgi:hypothetical protein
VLDEELLLCFERAHEGEIEQVLTRLGLAE